MKRIYPTKTNLETTIINKINNKYLINYCINDSLNILGIIVEINNIVIKKEYDKYKILLPEINSLEKYDIFLKEKIQNYKQIVINDNLNKYFEIKVCKLMDEYYKLKKNNITLYINHVKMIGFLNIPIIKVL